MEESYKGLWINQRVNFYSIEAMKEVMKLVMKANLFSERYYI